MTGFNTYRVHRCRPTPELEQQALALWSAGYDTLDIARRLAVPESQVANWLPWILEQRRKDREWNFDTLRAAP